MIINTFTMIYSIEITLYVGRKARIKRVTITYKILNRSFSVKGKDQGVEKSKKKVLFINCKKDRTHGYQQK